MTRLARVALAVAHECEVDAPVKYFTSDEEEPT